MTVTVANLLGVDQPDWFHGAACASVDPDLWFPEKGEGTRPAKSVCRSCDVQVECLEYALTHGERHGVGGGASERERHKMLRSRGLSLPRPPRVQHGPRHTTVERGDFPCTEPGCSHVAETAYARGSHRRYQHPNRTAS
ncbi:WhiB family transcriptional regulator [uncultured Jatrophihabitans sp.]|uniref:WhiB family transcriptional regulator n=1 Tax=uncultured Jatrophihabitans sp. TaxID=1610747 RepID=UPI0035C954D2